MKSSGRRKADRGAGRRALLLPSFSEARTKAERKSTRLHCQAERSKPTSFFRVRSYECVGLRSRGISRPSGSARQRLLQAQLFFALGDQNRLRLISRLAAGGPLSITSLGTGLRITRQAVSKHLRNMERAGLVVSRRRGRERLWQLQPRRLQDARYYLDQISAQWDQALERLRAYVEG